MNSWLNNPLWKPSSINMPSFIEKEKIYMCIYVGWAIAVLRHVLTWSGVVFVPVSPFRPCGRFRTVAGELGVVTGTVLYIVSVHSDPCGFSEPYH